MKFKVKVSDLQYAAKLVKDVIDHKAELAEQRGVSIKVNGDTAVFTAFSSDITLQARVSIQGTVDGEALIEASALYSAVSRFKPLSDEGVGTSDITISISDKSRKFNISAKTTYKDGSSVPHRRSIPLLDHTMFPDFSSIAAKNYNLVLPSEIIIDGIGSVSYASSSDQNNLLFTGMLFELNSGMLTMACSDGICLAEYNVPIDYEGEKIRTVIPSSLANKLYRSFHDGGDLKVAISKANVYFRTPNLIVGGPVISEEYPEYADILPTPEKFAVLPKSILLDNLLNLGYEAALEDDSRVSLSMAAGEASLKCLMSDNTGIKVEGFDGLFSFDSNLRLLALSIKSIGGNNIKIGFIRNTSPIYFLPTEESPSGASLKCILVPLNPV